MSGSSTTGGLNVAAKPFVPSFGAASSSSRLNPTARAFVPSFDAPPSSPQPNSNSAPSATSAATALNTAAPVFVPSSTAASTTATDSDAASAPSTQPQPSSAASASSASASTSSASSRPLLDPLLSSLPLPAPTARRPLTSSSSAKVRKPKSLQDDDDTADRRSAHSYSSRHANSAMGGLGGMGHYGLTADKGDGRSHASHENGVSFSSAGGSGPLPDGGLRQYSIDLLLSLRSLALSHQWPVELDDGCDAILGGKYNHSALNGAAQHDGSNHSGGSNSSKRQSGGGGHSGELFRSADKEKDSGANSSGWRDTLTATPPPAADGAAANTGTASAAAASSSPASLRPTLSLRPSTSLRPGASAQSSVGRLKNKQTSFQPHDKQQGGGGGGGQQQGRGGAGSGGGQQKDGGNAYRGKGKDAPLDIQVAPLERTEHRYTVVKDIPPDAKLLRGLNSILNKLTPEKFETLLEQVLALKITNVGLLRDVVTAIFEKALAEPNFSPTYAQFCVVLSEKLPTFADDEGEQTFRKLILNRCQAEFENSDHALSEQQQASMSQEDKDQHTMMVKRRTLGTIRFIGELYIRQLIASRIMRHCITLLFGDINAPVEEDIEALCRLLDTTGKFLEHSKGKDAKVNHDFLHTTLAQLSQLKERRELLSSRIRFMIADVLDVQKSGWVNRRAADQAKKISAVHQEAAKQEREAAQQAELQRMYQSMQQHSSAANRPSPASRMARPTDRYALPQPTQPTQPGQWETVGAGKGAKQGAAAAAISKHTASPKRAADSETNEEANAYAALNRRGGREEKEQDDDDEDDEEEEEEEEDEDEQEVDSAAGKRAGGSSALSADDIRDRASALVKELCSSEDVSDALLTVEELGAANCDASFVESALLAAMETKKESHKLLVCRLLAEASRRKLLASRALDGGVVALLAQVDDIAIDLPKCEEYCAIFIAQLAADSVLSLALLTPAVLQSVSSAAGAGSRFFLSVLQQMKRLAGGEEAVVAAVRRAQGAGSEPLKLLAVLDKSKEQAQKLLVDKKLEQLQQCIDG